MSKSKKRAKSESTRVNAFVDGDDAHMFLHPDPNPHSVRTGALLIFELRERIQSVIDLLAFLESTEQGYIGTDRAFTDGVHGDMVELECDLSNMIRDLGHLLPEPPGIQQVRRMVCNWSREARSIQEAGEARKA
ncbi:MAG: hypothetical protein K8S99_12255 [Planctomycetes bacterium]|nr:hypothetical protein [Planctomycetota bacterium]